MERRGKEEAYPIVVLVEVVGDHRFVPCERLLEVRERIARYAEGRRLDVMREAIKPTRATRQPIHCGTK